MKGAMSPFDCVAQWVVDDGNKERSNRAHIFDQNFTTVSPFVLYLLILKAGLFSGAHPIYGNILSVVVAASFTPSSSMSPQLPFQAPPQVLAVEPPPKIVELDPVVLTGNLITTRYLILLEASSGQAFSLDLGKIIPTGATVSAVKRGENTVVIKLFSTSFGCNFVRIQSATKLIEKRLGMPFPFPPNALHIQY